MKEIKVPQEALEAIRALQIEENEDECHLCEDKATVLYENNVEADGPLGQMLEEWDPFGGSGKSHNTTLDLDDNILTVMFYDDEGEEFFDEYQLVAE